MLDKEAIIDLVKKAQADWADAIARADHDAVAALYATDPNPQTAGLWTNEQRRLTGSEVNLVFNPTLDDDFLVHWDDARRYFAGTEDKSGQRKLGFAHAGWVKVYFDPTTSHQGHPKARRYITVFEKDQSAVAVGRYLFEAEKPADDGSTLMVTRLVVDYTFVYRVFERPATDAEKQRDSNAKTVSELKIIAHHSSLPIKQANAK